MKRSRFALIALPVALMLPTQSACTDSDQPSGGSSDALRDGSRGGRQGGETSSDAGPSDGGSLGADSGSSADTGIDATAGAFDVQSPAKGATVSGVIQVQGQAGSPWMNVAVYDVNNGYRKIGADVAPSNGSYTVSVDTTQLANGAGTLAVIAFSVAAGQAGGTSVEIDVSVDVNNGVASSTTPPTPGAGDIDIVSFGAVANASTDNRPVIQNAINAAQSKGVNVYVPAGVFGYSGTINLPGPVHLYGTSTSSGLNALDPANTTIYVTGSGASLSWLHLSVVANSLARQAPYPYERVTALSATNYTVDHMVIDGGAAAGIMNDGCSFGTISHNLVENTLADSIHMTGGTYNMQVFNNETINSGDDGIACVSYSGAGLNHDINAYNNHVHNNKYGRGMTVVGGYNITYTNNYVHDIPSWSCFYVAQESSYSTYASSNVTLKNNTAQNCGGGGGNHGGILIWGDTSTNDTVDVANDLVVQTNGFPTISVTGLNTNVLLTNYEIQGPPIYIQTPSQVIQNTPWTSGPVGYTGTVGP